ncbi:hypothetical protein LTR53_006409 [Teratosphaeriaceae sp. CCFEE 6253]|nr:hypothetical protein LTR53_006409 [Teratosphaeriaceae sp. CCFEE 6253]
MGPEEPSITADSKASGYDASSLSALVSQVYPLPVSSRSSPGEKAQGSTPKPDGIRDALVAGRGYICDAPSPTRPFSRPSPSYCTVGPMTSYTPAVKDTVPFQRRMVAYEEPNSAPRQPSPPSKHRWVIALIGPDYKGPRPSSLPQARDTD